MNNPVKIFLGTLATIAIALVLFALFYNVPQKIKARKAREQNEGQYGYRMELLNCNNEITDTWFSINRPKFTSSRAGCTEFTDFKSNEDKIICNGTFIITKMFLRNRE